MKKAVFYAILAAIFYSISTPLSKVFLDKIPPVLLAGLLYLGAGLGIGLWYWILKIKKTKIMEESLNKQDIPYVIFMVLLDIIAPILLMVGIKIADASSVSLINNFEIVVTSIIALVFFKEKISIKLWIGIILVVIASSILTIDFENGFNFNVGSLLAILACSCWGLENNCTRKIASKNTYQIVTIKGLCCGMVSIAMGLILKENIGEYTYIIYALLLGFVAYGLSIFVYVKAQNKLGAAKTSAYYSLAPFIGVSLSMIITWQRPPYTFFIALVVMIVAIYFVVKDKLEGEGNDL